MALGHFWRKVFDLRAWKEESGNVLDTVQCLQKPHENLLCSLSLFIDGQRPSFTEFFRSVFSGELLTIFVDWYKTQKLMWMGYKELFKVMIYLNLNFMDSVWNRKKKIFWGLGDAWLFNAKKLYQRNIYSYGLFGFGNWIFPTEIFCLTSKNLL